MTKQFYMACLVLVICFSKSFSQNATTAAKPYFQQDVAYTIDVTLIDTLNLLKGKLAIEYTNNSPDTLSVIYFHLWPNAYKNDRTAFNKQQVTNGNTNFYFSDAKNKGYIKDLAFKVDGKAVNVSEVNGQADVAMIDLPKALLPNQTISITTPFTVKIPTIFSRMGTSGNNDYQITQWYPKPAVYDNYGWHPMPYLDQGEFYSEFGKFTVNITVPENYIVAATGELQNESEKMFLADRIKSTDSVTEKTDSIKMVLQQILPASLQHFSDTIAATKTLTFIQNNIHDFAWFADKRFLIEKSEVDIAGKKVASYIYYLPKNYNIWHGKCKTINQSLAYYSSQVGNYPYASASAVDGGLLAGAGMEYPMITVIGNLQSKDFLEEVIVHEVGHNWFQGILGSNERDNGFMDEGFNTLIEKKAEYYIHSLDTNYDGTKISPFKYTTGALSALKTGDAQPVCTKSIEFSSNNYGNMMYYKTVSLLAQLEQYIGEDDFKKCMQSYYTQWHFKHPYPADFRKVVEENTTKDVAWLFDGMLPNNNILDFKFKKVKITDKNIQVNIKNITGTKSPVSVDIFRNDSIVHTSVIAPFEKNAAVILPKIAFDNIVIDGQQRTMDVNIRNNIYYGKGLWKKGRMKLNLNPIKSLFYNPTHQLFLHPIFGYNYYNGFLAGIVFHNSNNYPQRFQFYATPQFGLYSKTLEGMGGLSYAFFINKNIKRITIDVTASQYAYDNSKLNIDKRIFAHYQRIVPQATILFANHQPTKNITTTLQVKEFLIWKNDFRYTLSAIDSLYRPSVNSYQQTNFTEIKFHRQNKRVLNPFEYTAMVQGNQLFGKLTVEGKMKMHYNKPNKALHTRIFIGKFFNFASNKYDAYDYRLASTHTADNDYTFSNYYIGRSSFDKAITQQLTEQEGGMKLTTYKLGNRIGMSDNWMMAINVKSDLPIKLPITLRPFVDFMAYKTQADLQTTKMQSLFDAGVQVSLFNDRLQCNFPIFMSKEYRDYFSSTFSKKDKWKNQITFSVLINNITMHNIR